MEIKPYEPMGYLETTDNPPRFYNIPLTAVESVMESKNLPRDKRPEMIDLRKYGYGRESLSKIRWWDRLSESRWSLHHLIISQTAEVQQALRDRIESRGHKWLTTDTDNIKRKIALITKSI